MNRRTLLRGAGIAIGLPFLEAMRPAKTARAAEGFPRRFVTMYSANGTIHDAWVPKGGETSFELSRILAPLEAHKKDIIVLDGIDLMGGGGGDEHQAGTGGLLTGQMLNPGPFKGGSGSGGWANGVSLDQHLANHFGWKTRFRSREFAVQPSFGGKGNNLNMMSYLGSNQPIPAQSNPYQAFTTLFTEMGANPKDLARLRAERHTVLDAVMEEYRGVRASIGAEDNRRVDAHLTAIREIEQRLDSGGSSAVTCHKPGAPKPAIDLAANDNFPLIGRLMTDLMVRALACDLTRVATFQWSHGLSNTVHTWLGVNERHHQLSHAGDTNAEAKEQMTKITHWYTQQFAYLVDEMKKVVEGDGTLLDHSLVLWGNELGKGNTHSRLDVPLVLAGSAGGTLKTGRFLAYEGPTPHNNLLVSIANLMGVPTTSFGKADWCTGPLARL